MPEGKGNIFLTGFMGAGKSTVGEALAEKLNLPFHDTDALIEARCEQTIAEIFAQHGEAYFRDLESEIVHRMADAKASVVALGGGALLRRENVERLSAAGTIVYLEVDFDTIADRILGGDKRPLVSVMPAVGARQALYRLFEARKPVYAQAHLTVACRASDTPQQTARKILTLLEIDT